MLFGSWLELVANVYYQTVRQLLKIVLSIINVLRKDRKWNYIKCSIKNTKGRQRVEDKTGKKEQVQQIKNNNKYGRY